jgi:hypothetical protein
MRVNSVSIVLMSSVIGYDTTNEKNRSSERASVHQ